ncbi:TonB-dependent receptor domain-containing protein [Sphingomonas prati]|uniref:Outer membrane receptor protein involved in Fe transport n=1 Tax=Sphingomonas prati TaxID=1843237 RepID=A0A7W9F224_9SPHN|nr:TonB-dependent receptor [Sphingomonas prati]MBB5730067.1 outer membrane receptor protein involved in Fe transport [Sphingomonas prati]GGE91195.1 TonB-dependent receptor [Sphingomonas prati]
MLKPRFLAASALAGTFLLLATPSLAQTSNERATTGTNDIDPSRPVTGSIATEEDAAADGDSVVVTGSRIRRAGFDTLEPATVVSSEYLQARGLTNVADALNELPGFGVGVSPEGGQSGFGVGQNFVSRFGLGSARTLTLVNGRRFVSTNAPSIFGNTPGLQVDLNVVPAQLIDRIENVAIGGAPTYGSDAIAGTVNVILKRNYEGVNISGLGGLTSRGDNGRYNLAVVAGHNFAEGRGNITVAGSYDKSNGVLGNARRRLRESILTGTNPLAGSAVANLNGRTPATDGRLNPNVPFNTGNADGIPNSVFIRDGRIFSLTAGGLLLPSTGTTTLANGLPRGFGAANTLVQFDPSGNIVPFNPGITFGGQNASGGDGFLLNDTTQLTSGLERITGNILANYELTDNVRAFFEGTYYRANARELADQSIYNATLFGGVSAPLTFQSNDPRLSAQARAQLAALGATSFRLSRASTDLVNNNASSRTEVYRGVAGIQSDFDLFGKAFNFEASANYGRSEGTFFANVLNQQRFVNAINNCQPATAATKVNPDALLPVVDAACVPLNVFGQNQSSAAARAYVTGVTKARSTLEQQVYNINFGTSDLINPYGAGPVGFNVGYEHRNEKASFNPDAFQLAGLGRSVPIGGTSGEFNTDELFGELLIPVVGPLNNIPLVDSIDLEAKARYVQNSINGGFTTYTFGGRYSPVRGIQFRGNYTRSLRAPVVTEAFTPQSPAFNTFNDPCDSTQIASGTNPAVRQRNCAAFYESYGLNGATFISAARLATVPTLTGGNPDLDNEAARSYTYGVVLQPRFIPRFRVAVDWNRIRIKGNIVQLSNINVAEGCYDNPDFDTSDVDNANQFCSLITRVRSADAARNGQLSNDAAAPALRTTFVNGAYQTMKGLTADMEYNFPLDGIGMADSRIDLAGNFFYLQSLTNSNNGVTVTRQAGAINNPKYTAQGNVGFTRDVFGIDFQANYQSGVVYLRSNTVETQDILKLGDYWNFNLSTSLRIAESSVFRFTISNLTDKMPPFPLGTLAFGAYDFLGRRFAVSFQHKL